MGQHLLAFIRVHSRPFAVDSLGSHCVILCFFAFLVATPSSAADTDNAEVPPTQVKADDRETVIVPYNPKLPPGSQKPDQLYLPYERFLELWEAAKEHKRPQDEREREPAPMEYGLTSARYDARLEERGLTGTGQLELFTGRPWVKVPLPFAGANVSSLTVDNRPAVWRDGALLVEKPGRHQLKIAFDLPRSAGAVDFKWGIPRATAAVLALTLPKAETTATVEPGSGAVERLEGGARIVTAALGSAGEVRIHLRSAEKAAAAGAPVSATVSETAKLSATWEEFQGDVAFTFPSAVQDRFTVLLEKGLTLTDLSAPNLKSWTLRPEGDGQALDLILYEPAKEALTVHLAAQRLPAAAGAELRNVPLFTTKAGRTELASLAILAAERATATLTPSAGLRQITWDGTPPAGWRLAGAFAGSGALPYRLAPAPSRREAKVEYLYQAGRRQLELFASMELLAHGDALDNLRIELPPGFEVETLQSARPHDWWRADGSLLIAFQNATPASTRLVLHLVQKAPPAAALEIRSLRFPDFHKITSEVAVAARKGVEAAVTLPPQVVDVKPAEAAASFQVLAPLERKRGFRVATGDFTAQVKLAALAPRVEALWALRVEAHDAWLSLSYAVRMTVRQGSLETARFTLPAALPEARVAGGEVRDFRSHVEGEVRIYDVGFQNEVFSAAEFTVDLELPHSGEAALPSLLFPGLPRASGFLALENASEGEMRLAATGLDKATVAELPWEVPNAGRAQLFRVPASEWRAKVIVERLEKATGRLAFCPWAELSTAFRRDGTAWHKAVWHLQNRALQFLPVRLPAGAELVSVKVAGQSVRADAGSAEGGAALLIPLIRTKPGELSYDVEAVYRTADKALAGSTKRRLDDPDLVGITVERTFWNVWAPAGFEISPSVDGNMERIIEEVAAADKLNDTLQELKSLTSIINLTGASTATRHVALDNFRRLQTTLEQDEKRQSEANKEVEEAAKAPAAKGDSFNKTAISQNGYVQKKLGEVNEELRKQVKQIEGAELTAQAAEAPMISQPPNAALPYKYSAHGNVVPSAVSNLGQTVNQAGGNAWKLNPNKDGVTPDFDTATPNGPAGASKKDQQQLALNDNVVFNYGSSPAKPADTAAGKERAKESVDELRFERNGEQAANQALSSARANGININNASNSVYNLAPPNAAPLTPGITADGGFTKSGSGTIILNGGNTYTGTTTVNGGTLTISGAIVPPPSATPAQPVTAGNRSGQLAISQNAIDALLFGVAGTSNPAAPAPATPSPLTVRNGQSSVEVNAISTTPRASPTEAFLGFGTVGERWNQQPGMYRDLNDPAGKPLATPVPDRRITLAVEFPTEGEPLHFKKLKGAATLQVELDTKETTHRWWSALLIAVAAAGLIWARRRFGRETGESYA